MRLFGYGVVSGLAKVSPVDPAVRRLVTNRFRFRRLGVLPAIIGVALATVGFNVETLRCAAEPPRASVSPLPGGTLDSQTQSETTASSAGWAAEALAEAVQHDERLRARLGLDFAAYRTSLDELPIGVFDSGVGGLTVLEQLLTIDQHDNATGRPGPDGIADFQNESFIYLGDQANMPYGNYAAAGREDYLRQLILNDAIFLLGRRYWPAVNAANPVDDKPPVKAIVIACNTATAYGLDDLRAAIQRWDLPVPVIGVVEAGSESVVRMLSRDTSAAGAIGVLATVGTCSSEAYPRAIARAAGQRGRRLPTVWQQGSLGLAGAIEGAPTFLVPPTALSEKYEGPAVANGAAPIDPALAAVYDFDPDGLIGDPDQPQSWRLNSIENYVRYDVVTMVENYRRSGATQAIEAVVLGCTHFPYESERIHAALLRLREYRDADGKQPYRELIAPEVQLVDPGVLTAQQLFRQLFLERRLSRTRQEAKPELHGAFISVPAPQVAADLLTEEGGFRSDYKYGREPQIDSTPDVRVVPLQPTALPASAQNLLRQHAPITWESLTQTVTQ